MRIIYIRPYNKSISGIRKYSELFLASAKKYLPDVELVDFDDIIAPYTFSGDRNDLSKTIKGLVKKGVFGNFDMMLTEIGINEPREFYAASILKDQLPSLPSIIVLHDAPKISNNLTTIFIKYEKSKFVRVLRRLFNMTFGKLIEKKFINQGHSFIVLSETAYNLMSAKGIADIHRFKLMNFFDSPNVRELPVERTDGRSVIGFCGFIAPHKGVDLLLAAASVLKQRDRKFIVRIAGTAASEGDKHYLADLHEYVKANSLSDYVRFEGFLNDNEMPIFFDTVDMLVLPYRRQKSGSSSGPLKWSKAFHLPVVVSDIQVFRDEVAENEEGLFFTEGDSDSLADKLEILLNYENLKRMRSNISLTVYKTSPESILAQYGSLFSELLQGK